MFSPSISFFSQLMLEKKKGSLVMSFFSVTLSTYWCLEHRQRITDSSCWHGSIEIGLTFNQMRSSFLVNLSISVETHSIIVKSNINIIRLTWSIFDQFLLMFRSPARLLFPINQKLCHEKPWALESFIVINRGEKNLVHRSNDIKLLPIRLFFFFFVS